VPASNLHDKGAVLRELQHLIVIDGIVQTLAGISGDPDEALMIYENVVF
jgi:hypothetical protein